MLKITERNRTDISNVRISEVARLTEPLEKQGKNFAFKVLGGKCFLVRYKELLNKPKAPACNLKPIDKEEAANFWSRFHTSWMSLSLNALYRAPKYDIEFSKHIGVASEDIRSFVSYLRGIPDGRKFCLVDIYDELCNARVYIKEWMSKHQANSNVLKERYLALDKELAEWESGKCDRFFTQLKQEGLNYGR